MATYNKYWKVWLRPNLLTRDIDNDYIAEVSTLKNTLHEEDIVKRIVAEGSEVTYETLLSSINKYNRIICDAVSDGCTVVTDTCRIAPRVGGSWLGKNAQFDPEQHSVMLDMNPGAMMRTALANVGVEVLGVREDGGAFIGLVEDTFTGLSNDTATAGEDIRIEGNKIKVDGTAEGIGIFFINEEGVATQVTRRLTQNGPKILIARVPATLAAGDYRLRIVTQHCAGRELLKEPRTIEYSNPLHVKAAVTE